MSDQAPVVVVGVDGSRESVQALDWAIRYARCAAGTVRAVIAWDQPVEYGYYGSTLSYVGPGDMGLGEAAVSTLAAVVQEAAGEPPTVPLEQRVTQGYPAKVLIDEARSADLLVVGARGHGAFKELVLGSVSSHCVHHAACPVVVVRHQPTPS